ncbi:MAG: methyl-accepting chemotaxis protein [Vibrio sp.]
MKKLGLKLILMMSILLLVSVSVTISNYFSYRQQEKDLKTQILHENKLLVSDQAALVEQFIREKVMGLAGIGVRYKSADLPAKTPQDFIDLSSIFATTLNTGSSFIGLEKSGDAYWNLKNASWPDHKFEGDIRNQSYYKDGRKAQVPAITEPYPDEADSNIYWISMVQRIQQGMIGADMKLGFLNKLVVDVAKQQGAKAFIFNKDTTVLASSDLNTLKPGVKGDDVAWLKPLANTVVNQQAWTKEFAQGTEKILFSHQINVANKQWYFVITVDKADVFASLVSARNSAIITTLILVFISVIIAFLVIQIVYRPILSLKSMIESLSSGEADLTKRLDVTTDDDLGHIAQSVNVFVDKLQTMMIEIRSATLTLQDNVGQMEQLSQDNAQMLNNHVIETEQVVTAIDEMSATASSMASDISNAAELTQRTNDESYESSKLVAQAQNNITLLINGVEHSSQRVHEMNDETQNISSILGVIGDISEQTNLLALNAAIEAARAGEQGRGFAVVADEVRTLANRTKESTEQISKVLQKLVSGSQDVVVSMDKTKSQCEQTAQESQSVHSGLEKVIHSISEINDISAQIATAAEEQTSVTQDVSRNMNALNDIVNNLASNGDKTVSGMRTVADVNKQLTEIIQRFKI